MSSGQPDLCVDIFSHMANMLASFNNNLRGESFSHSDGFSQVPQSNAAANPVNFEQNLNEWLTTFFMGAMVLFLLY